MEGAEGNEAYICYEHSKKTIVCLIRADCLQRSRSYRGKKNALKGNLEKKDLILEASKKGNVLGTVDDEKGEAKGKQKI